MRVTVVVMGDVGRSPRMQYHALALASGIAEVDVIGYAGSAVYPTIRDHDHIAWHFLRHPRQLAREDPPRWLFVVHASWRVVRDCLQLCRLLLRVVRKPDVILIQTPPAIPTLLVATVAARLRAARLVIDWHNFGYTMLALRLGRRHPLVRLAHRYERVLGRHADAHLCVSRGMQAVLRHEWGIADAVVLYDRPAAWFGPTPREAREELFRRLDGIRPPLIVSSTSWTADEDFSVLLEAVSHCEKLIQVHDESTEEERPFPELRVLITGRGPLQRHYESRIARMATRKIHLQTVWLAPEDYPVVLGAADLGLCLHRSSSGLDLPMKVADMFGSGLPVCALDYGPCLAEQVQHGVNGLLFRTSAELAEQLYTLFRRFPDETPLLDQLRRNVSAGQYRRWTDEWRAVAEPVFRA